MNNKTLSDDKIQFSGHETFPLRQLWLKKAYAAVRDIPHQEYIKESKGIFGERGIMRFGVGKIMVDAIRHWALACGIIEGDDYILEGGENWGIRINQLKIDTCSPGELLLIEAWDLS